VGSFGLDDVKAYPIPQKLPHVSGKSRISA
jgi:hypothetical protein